MEMIFDDSLCVCGHQLDEHRDNGTCDVADCICGGFEPDNFEEDR